MAVLSQFSDKPHFGFLKGVVTALTSTCYYTGVEQQPPVGEQLGSAWHTASVMEPEVGSALAHEHSQVITAMQLLFKPNKPSKGLLPGVLKANAQLPVDDAAPASRLA